MIATLFKGFFAIFIAIAALILAVFIWADYHLSGSMSSIWILLAGGAALVLHKSRNKSESSGGRNPIQAAASQNVFQGHGANIELRDDGISIARHGVASFLTQGMKGEKRVPFNSITAVQLRDAGRHISGYIQFSILGGNESNRGIWDATLDENTVMFTTEQSARFSLLRNLVEKKLAEVCRAPVAVAPQSVADELAKLADLQSKGILTGEEFARQKAHVLAR